MAITTIAGVNTALPGQMLAPWEKAPVQSAGLWSSSWILAGSPGTGVAPSSGLAGDVPTKATVGAINFVNPASGNSYLGRMVECISFSGNMAPIWIAVYDRLWHNSGISATATSPQTINSVALTRPSATAGDVEAWWEVYAVMGTGTPTVTLAYTDQDGNIETTGSSGALATAMPAGRAGQFQLAAGDTGVRSIQTWTASATFTSGTIGLVLRRMVTMVITQPAAMTIHDALSVGLPRIYDDACLEILLLGPSSQAVTGGVCLNLVQG